MLPQIPQQLPEQFNGYWTDALPYSIIEISGPDAEKFLQGQLSCDLTKLTTNHSTLGTVNTPKGRMIGLFTISRLSDRYLLRLESTCAQALIDHLAKYKVFFKCEIRLCDELKAFISFGPPAHFDELPNKEGECVETDNGILHCTDAHLRCYEIWQTSDRASSETKPGLEEYWHCIACLKGIPELYPETIDTFVLQYLNLQHLDAVSFNKGCYTGQEIIARMKYLGKLKKQMFLIHNPAESNAKPGSGLVSSEGKKLGELVRLHYHPDFGCVGLAVLPISFQDTDNNVFLEEVPDITFEVKNLEYS